MDIPKQKKQVTKCTYPVLRILLRTRESHNRKSLVYFIIYIFTYCCLPCGMCIKNEYVNLFTKSCYVIW